jgi:hypothetical protein
MTAPRIPLVIVCTIALVSCKEEEIRTYRVAGEEATPVPALRPAAAPAVAGVSAASGRLRWEVPAGWQAGTAGEFQTALYVLPGGAKAAVSTLPGEAGGEAANVNRWRRQVGLEEVANVGGETLAAEGAGVSAKWFDLNGESESILAAIISLPDETWFFKLSGPTAEIDASRQAFMTLLGSIHMESAAAPPGAAPVPAAAAPAPAADGKPQIALEIPAGWVKSEGSGMRVASFSIPGEGVPDGDVSVIPLAGESGSTLANVNRWRAQVRLPALASEDDPALGTKASGAAGEVLITHMASEENLFDGGRKGAISTAILKTGSHTWFFKLTGEAELVARHRAAFEAFVLSAKFP